jgi:hypothetical protein
MKGLARPLFKAFIFSVILSIAASSIYYAVAQKGIDYMHALPKIFEGILFLNIIIFIMSLPSLFLVNAAYWNNLAVRLLLYFAGPVVFIITALTLKLPPADKAVYLLSGVIFLVVRVVFYYLAVKKRK